VVIFLTSVLTHKGHIEKKGIFSFFKFQCFSIVVESLPWRPRSCPPPWVVTLSSAARIPPLFLQYWHRWTTSRHDIIGYALPISVPINANHRDMFCEMDITGAYEWQKVLEDSAGKISGFGKV